MPPMSPFQPRSAAPAAPLARVPPHEPAPDAEARREHSRSAAAPGESFDQQALRRIEGIRQRHSKLRETRAMAHGNVNRLSPENEASSANLTAKYGTDDLDVLQASISDRRVALTREIDDYEASVATAEARIRILEGVT